MSNSTFGKPQQASSSLQAQYGGHYAFARDITQSSLAESKAPEMLFKLTGKLERFAEKEINSIHAKIAALGEQALPILPACHKGCWHCCTHIVGASVPEILEVARHIRETWSPDDIAGLMERIAVHKQATERFRKREGDFPPRPMCPLLKDACCSVWLNRPLICRGWNSVSVEDCIRKRDHPEDGVHERGVAAQFAVSDFVRQGMLDGMHSLGYSKEPVELIYGLEIALKNPDAAERYLAGEDLFAPAREGMDRWE